MSKTELIKSSGEYVQSEKRAKENSGEDFKKIIIVIPIYKIWV